MSRTIRITVAVGLTLLLAASAFARRDPEEISGDWEDLGPQVQRSRIYARDVGRDTEGNEVYYLGMIDAKRAFVLALDPLTGKPAGPRGQFNFDGYPGQVWGLTAHSNGKAYATTGSGGIFEIDAAAGRQRFIGEPPEGERILWEVYEAFDGHLYGGTYPNAKLVRVNLDTYEVEDLGRMDPEQKYVRSVAIEGEYLYAGCGVTRPAVWAYHIPTGERIQLLPDEAREGPGWGVAMRRIDAHIYVWGSGDGGWRVSGLDMEYVEQIPHYVYQELEDGTRLYAWDEAGPNREYTVAPRGEEQYTVNFDYDTTGAELWDLFPGPDGRIYGNTHTPITLFAFDPETGETEVFGDPVGHAGQVYASTWIDGKLHMAAYSACTYTIWDPEREWDFGEESENNPRRIGDTRPQVQRAGDLIAAPDGRHTIVAGLPGYGHVGGGVVVVDPETADFEVFEQPVMPQSPWALATTPDDEIIAIGTSLYGGTGTDLVITLGRVVLWNWRAGEAVEEFAPWPEALDRSVFPRVDQEVQVNSLLRLDNELWMIGAPDGRIAVYDFDTGELAYLDYWDYGAGELVHRPEDGMIYSNMRGWIVRIDPATRDHELLATYPGLKSIAISGDYLYAFDDHRLVRLAIE